MSKKTVCVLFGGQSSEHDVSCVSAASVVKNLDRDKYDIVAIGITKDGKWLLCDCDADKISNGDWQNHYIASAVITPDASQKGVLVMREKNGIIETNVINVDVVFPVLHGKYGEDGTVQGLLELSKMPYVGCGVLSSSISMDKTVTKQIVKNINVPQAKWVVVTTYDDFCENIKTVENTIGYPCFVKPANTGSSVGISRADNGDELRNALEIAAEHDYKILVEEFINGREIECAVLGNIKVEASVLGEIIPKAKFYDYDAKYNDASTGLVIGADLPTETSEKLKKYAKKIFAALDCRGLSRVDFFVHKENGEIYFNEINTMPGFTSISMYPKLWEASGIKYPDLLTKLIDLALDK